MNREKRRNLADSIGIHHVPAKVTVLPNPPCQRVFGHNRLYSNPLCLSWGHWGHHTNYPFVVGRGRIRHGGRRNGHNRTVAGSGGQFLRFPMICRRQPGWRATLKPVAAPGYG